MGIKWSEQQEKVINHRNKNLLVSAAAGSGKTAVLVRRIISLLTDKENPTDLDRMLIVTFTKAAAGEMKERIRKTLEEMIENDAENEHLRSQAVLIHNANISTIHSFCSQLIKNYFYEIDIDPSFRMLEETESRLMMSDCAKEALENAYEEQDSDVLEFTAAYSVGKSNKSIRELIIKAYNLASAKPWPKEWILNAAKWWGIDSEEELESSGTIVGAFEKALSMIKALKAQAEINLKQALEPGGPSSYIPALESDLEILTQIEQASDYKELSAALKDIKFKSLGSGRKKPDEDAQLREILKTRHNEIKDTVSGIRNDYLSSDIGGILEENRLCRAYVAAFLRLLNSFSEIYAARKRSRSLMDFSDLEHFALKILYKENADGTVQRSDAAKEIASRFDYVMTDEYQDSNDIQELILSAVSGNEDGRENRFMVGDIKQSIYGFRNARPEIFINRYDEYKVDSHRSDVIDLHDNYRSSTGVIGALNYIFERLMSRTVGGVEYDDAQALHFGDRQITDRPGLDNTTELLLIDGNDPGIDKDGKEDALIEAEAAVISSRIKSLMAVTRQAGDEKSALSFKDFAVLVRAGAMAEKLNKSLQKEGIPSYTESKAGYFTTTEVSTMLSYISILDNPLQDIPFAAVLFSPIAGCTAEELAEIRLAKEDACYYKAALEYLQRGKNKILTDKLKRFFEDYRYLSEKAVYMPVHALLNEIYAKTGYRSYAAAMPGGKQRAANLDMLLQRASAYEKTSYSGLFNFIRYIEEMKKYDEDLGEAGLFSENSDAVRIMTIHKSKGLEFPVVFLSGCARGFNMSGTNGNILLHKDMGIGLDAVDFKAGKKKNTLYKKLISDEMKKEAKSEELRVLYVALTRAKEKLYITAAEKNLTSKIENLLRVRNAGDEIITDSKVLGSNSFLDYILLAISDSDAFEPLAHWAGIYDEKFSSVCGCLKSSVIAFSELEREKYVQSGRLKENLKLIPKTAQDVIYDKEIHDLLNEIDAYEYPFKENAQIPVKVSVSELKRMHMEFEDEQTGLEAVKPEEIIPYIPSFIAAPEAPEEGYGAIRGTAYHKLWRFFDYRRVADVPTGKMYGAIKEMTDELEKAGLMSREEIGGIYLRDFVAFAASPLGRRMCAADIKGLLFREQPFTAVVPSELADEHWSGEDVVVQGVIDAYFEEEDGFVLVDYKTDYVKDETGASLVSKYRTQLDIYADVLKSSNKIVKEKIIYSTHLKKSILL